MKKQLIILVVCLVVVGALGVALWLLMGYEPEPDENSSSTVSTAVQLTERSDYDLDTVTVENEHGSYTVRNLGDGQYTLKGYEDAPLSNAMLKSVANAGVSLRADSIVTESAEDLSAYGLQPPAVRLKASYTDGSAFSLELGAQAPANSGVYARLPEENTVYLLTKTSTNNIFNAPLQFIDKTIVESPDDLAAQQSGTTTMPETATFGGSFRAEEIVIRRTKKDEDDTAQSMGLDLFEMVSPKARSIDSNEPVNVLSGLLSLSASEISGYKPTEAQRDAFGLTEPYSTVRFTYLDAEEKEQTVSLRASARDDEGFVFIEREGVPVVYRVRADSLPWYEMAYQDFLSRLQLLPFIDDVKTMTLDFENGDSFVCALEGEGDDLTVTMNGQAVSEKEFRQLYQNVIGLPSEDFTSDTPAEGAAVLARVTFAYRDGRPADNLALIASDASRKAFLSINGESEFYTKSSYAGTLRENCRQLQDGETVGELY